MDSQTKLKRVVIKEELVILTGDYINALILNQFLYWSERTKDFDKFVQEEKERGVPEDSDLNIELTFGWIYKTADELSTELMLRVSGSTIRRHITKLVKAGWIDQRHNPNHKWDRTLQYRPNIINIQTDLEVMGYSLEGYPLLQNAFFKIENGSSKIENRSAENEGALPKTTLEITTENMAQSAESDFSDLFPEPAQAGVTQQSKPLDDNGKAHLLALGTLPDDNPDPEVYAVRQELQAAGWEIQNSDVELAIVYFVLAVRSQHPGFKIPNDTGTRKDWHKSVNAHLQNYKLSELQDLYNEAIIKMIEKNLSYWRPGSLTKWALSEIVNKSDTAPDYRNDPQYQAFADLY